MRDVQVPPAPLRLHLGEYVGGLHARQRWRMRLASAAMTKEVLRRSQDGSTPVTKEVGGLPGMNRRGLGRCGARHRDYRMRRSRLRRFSFCGAATAPTHVERFFDLRSRRLRTPLSELGVRRGMMVLSHTSGALDRGRHLPKTAVLTNVSDMGRSAACAGPYRQTEVFDE